MPREKTPPPPPPPPPGLSFKAKIAIILGSGVAVLLLLVVLAALGGEEEAPKVRTAETILIEDPDHVLSGAILDLGNFTVNLGADNRFVTARLSAELFDFVPPPGIDKKVGAVRDVVISVLAKKNSEELLSLQGKEKLRLELLNEINERLKDEENPIVDIYYTDFFIQ